MTGTTATVCLIRDSSEMVLGHVGDSRAVLCRKGSSVRLSVDHDPDDPDENQRVTKKGGRIIQNSQGISQVSNIKSQDVSLKLLQLHFHVCCMRGFH